MLEITRDGHTSDTLYRDTLYINYISRSGKNSFSNRNTGTMQQRWIYSYLFNYLSVFSIALLFSFVALNETHKIINLNNYN